MPICALYSIIPYYYSTLIIICQAFANISTRLSTIFKKGKGKRHALVKMLKKAYDKRA